MHAVDIVQERTGTVPAGVAGPRPRSALDHQAEPPAPLLPEHALVPAQPQWEQILVVVGLDRESRAMSVRERAVRPARRFGRTRLV